jgi:hypothetical protein
VGHEQVAQRGDDRDRAARGATLRLDLAHLRVPAPLDADRPASEVDGAPAEGLRFTQPQTAMEQRPPQRTIVLVAKRGNVAVRLSKPERNCAGKRMFSKVEFVSRAWGALTSSSTRARPRN